MSFNRYLYVNNNPYKYTDPDGKFIFTAIAVAAIAYSAYEGYQDGGATGALAEASGYNDAMDSVSSFQSGDYSGAAVAAAGIVCKACKVGNKLKVLKKSQLKSKGIDAEAFKESEVGSKQGAKFNMAADKNGNVSLTPVKKGATDPIPTNQKLDDIAKDFPLEKKN
jgi:hypothetical protein